MSRISARRDISRRVESDSGLHIEDGFKPQMFVNEMKAKDFGLDCHLLNDHYYLSVY